MAGEKNKNFSVSNEVLTQMNSALYYMRKDFENLSESKENNKIQKNLSWLFEIFTNINEYFFGKGTKHLYPTDSEEFKQRIEETKTLINEMNGKYDKHSFNDSLKFFDVSESVFSSTEKLMQEESAFDVEKEKDRVGALGGEGLKQELLDVANFIDQTFDQGNSTATYYLQTLSLRIKRSLSTNEQGQTELDFNNPAEVEKTLKVFSKTLIDYQSKHPFTPKENVAKNRMVSYKKDIFREELVESLLTPFMNKIKAINLNKELVAQGKEPLEFETADFITEKATAAWEDYVKEREEAVALADYERKPIVDKIQGRMQKIAKDCVNVVDKKKVDTKKLIVAIKAFMYLNKAYQDRRAYKNEDLEDLVSEDRLSRGMDEFKLDAEKFVKNVSADEIKKMFSEPNARDLFNLKMEEVKAMPDKTVVNDAKKEVAAGPIK